MTQKVTTSRLLLVITYYSIHLFQDVEPIKTLVRKFYVTNSFTALCNNSIKGKQCENCEKNNWGGLANITDRLYAISELH